MDASEEWMFDGKDVGDAFLIFGFNGNGLKELLHW